MMSAAEMILWYAIGLIGVLGSALFSGLETGIYLVNRVRLHVMAHARRAGAAVLEGMLTDRNRLLGTLLIGNNAANYVASLAIAALLEDAGYFGWRQVAVNTAILAPVLFIFGEVLPKDMFRSHTDRLTPLFARPLRWLQVGLTVTGALPLINLVSRLIRRVTGAGDPRAATLHPRRVVTWLMRESAGHGVITAYQSAMVDRVLRLGRVRARDVMTPWDEVTVARADQPPEAIWSLADRVPVARLPLLENGGKPVGILEVYDVLLHEAAECPPLKSLARPVVEVDPDATCREALFALQKRRSSLGIVLEDGRPIGVVTTKDLVEPIVGELDVW